MWVDLYDLINCDVISKGAPVRLVISIGPYKTDPVDAKYKQITNSYKFPQVQVPALVDLKLPYDFDQIPDIFIDVFSNTTFSDNVRVAYCRIKA